MSKNEDEVIYKAELTNSRKLTVIISLVSLCVVIATWSLNKTSDVAYKLGEMNKQVQINTEHLSKGKRFTWSDGLLLESRLNADLQAERSNNATRLAQQEARTKEKFLELETRTASDFKELKSQMLRFETKMDGYFQNSKRRKGR